ncbi:MAG: hypothetical protein AAGA63_10430 [Pseudomonadota bacterium]
MIFILHSYDVCSGGIGSGVTCNAGILSGYYEATSTLFEISIFILIGIVWALFGVIIWILLLFLAFMTPMSFLWHKKNSAKDTGQ